MVTKTNSKEEQVETYEPNPLFEATRKILLAGIGAIALGKEEIEDFVQKLVDRGEIAEKDGRRLISEMIDKRRKTARGAEEDANKRIQEMLDRLNVPKKKDIEILTEQVAKLTKKVEDLTKTKS